MRLRIELKDEIMTDKVRCPGCRGVKRVPKLGGMIGDCNTCKGEGTVFLNEIVKPVKAEIETPVAEIVDAVSKALPTSTKSKMANTTWINDIVAKTEPSVKVDPKRALYRRKKEI